MANITTVARPYAKAILELAKSSKIYSDWSAMLNFLSAIALDPLGAKVLHNLAMSPAEKVNFICSLVPGALNQQGENLVKILARAKRLLILPALCNLYQQMSEDEQGQVDIDLTVAMPIDQAELNNIQQLSKENFSGAVVMFEQTDPELIGGGVAQIGNRVIDASIRGRLHAMHNLLKK